MEPLLEYKVQNVKFSDARAMKAWHACWRSKNEETDSHTKNCTAGSVFMAGVLVEKIESKKSRGDHIVRSLMR